MSSPATLDSVPRLRKTSGGGAESARLVRQQLTQGQHTKPEFDYELLLMFARNELGASVTIPLLAIIIALASMYWANPREPLIWLAVLLAARSGLTRLCRNFVNEPRTSVDVGAWQNKLIAAETLYGLAWAGVALAALD